jgi:hypothetical protein
VGFQPSQHAVHRARLFQCLEPELKHDACDPIKLKESILALKEKTPAKDGGKTKPPPEKKIHATKIDIYE